MSKRKKTRGSGRIEQLEARRLLTLTIDGTSGNDSIILSVTGNPVTGHTIHANVNGTVTDYDDDSHIVINAGNGSDSLAVRTLGGETVDVLAGTGDDTLTVAQGNFTDDINGIVNFGSFAVANGGTDSLIVDDTTGNGTFQGTDYDVSSLAVEAEEVLGTARVTWDGGIESKLILGTQGDDTFYISSLAAGTTLNGGSGNDDFEIGGSSHIVQDNFVVPLTDAGSIPLAAKLDGGSGLADIVNIDDSNSASTRALIDVQDNTILGNISAVDCADLRVYTHQQNSFPEVVGFSGTHATGNFVTVYGGGYDDIVELGHVTPINVPSYGVSWDFQLGGGINEVNIYDRDRVSADTVGTRWGFSGNTVSAAQDGFSERLTTHDQTFWYVGCDGSSPREFDMAKVEPESTVQITGGFGNDLVTEVNQIDDGQSPSLPAYNQSGNIGFTLGKNFVFNGGAAGTDTIRLDCSAGTTAGSGSTYSLSKTALLRTTPGAPFDDFSAAFLNIANINFTADSTNNTIRLGTFYNNKFDYIENVTIDGFFGNDTFTNQQADGSLLSLYSVMPLVSLRLIGGFATDLIELDDSGDGAANYDFLGTGQTLYSSAARAVPASLIGVDVETFDMTGTLNADTFIVEGKPASMALFAVGNSGNDTFIVGGGDLDSLGLSNNLTVSGGLGNDSIEFDDHSDQAGGGETDAYAWNNQEISKGAGADIIYTTFESQQLDASTNGSGVVNSGNVVNLNAATISTTIIGGAGRACLINAASGDLSSITAPVTLVMGIAGGANINDQASTGDKNYLLSPGLFTVAGAQTVSFSGAGITLNANLGNNTIVVTGAAAGAPLIINGGDGNDSISAGGGNVDQNLLSTLSVNGGTGTDTVAFDNTIDATFESETLSGATFTDGLTHSFSGVESVQIDTGPGGGAVNLNNVAVVAVVTGGSGNDAVNVGAGDLDSNLLANVTINGNAGTDTVQLNDSSPSAGGSYICNGGTFRKGNLGKTVSVTGIEGDTLQTSRGDDAVTITGVTYPLEILTGTGNDTVTANTSSDVSFNTGAETVEGFGSFGDTISVNPGGTGAAVMTVFHSDSVASVSTAVGGKLVIGTGNVLTNTHDLTNTGVIDLSGGALIVNAAASQVTQYQTWLKAGYAGGAWNGTSITINKVVTPGAINSALAAQDHTHFAVGFAPASAIFSTFPATFVGQSVASTAMLVRYTTVGDANLDGKTNALDFNALATNFGSTTANWYQGDLNYDGKVNTADFNALALNFNANLASAAPLAAVETSMPPAGALTSRMDLFGKKAIGGSESHDDLSELSL